MAQARYVLRQAWILGRAELHELLRRPRTLASFYLQFVVVTLIVLGPLYIFNRQRGALMTAAYLAGLINAVCLQQFSGRVVGRLESGEYETYLLAPLPILSVYLANLMSFLLMAPVFGLIYSFVVLILRASEYQPALFVAAFLSCVLLNASWSILIAAVHLAYRSIRQLATVASILAMFFSILLVPVYESPLRWLLQPIPWTHSTLLVIQATQPFVEGGQVAASLVYILAFAAMSLPLAARVYRAAENKAKRDGFSTDMIRL